MKLTIPDFSSARVLVAGDVMLDRYWRGGASRISPEAPVPVVHIREVEERPGGAGNVALNIATLGASATLVGLTGEDEPADALEQRLGSAGIECHFCRLLGLPTVTKLRIISRQQQLIRLDFEGDFGSAGRGADAMQKRYRELLPEADVVLLSDYAKGALQPVTPFIESAREEGRRVLVDPKSRDFSIYRGASLITPNMAEFEAVVGPCRHEEELAEKGRRLIRELELEALLVTRGEHGMTLLRAEQPELHLPTRAREVFDVTGAGDTVISVLAAALAAGESQERATALANLAAGIVVGKLGTAAISVPELRQALREESGGGGVMSEEQLLLAVQDARSQGERIVMTNGCFDILHAGHVAYLEQARRLGDRLIVAVNDDASVAALKGSGRPVNPLERRMAVLAGLQAVDWVVPFSESTPERLICSIRPDCLVKGGDYRPEEIAGYDCVIASGGEVRVLDFAEGISTSGIISTIRSGQ
ncbi:MAG TPA: bifunctional D-glycero-beta-D-manno-heptose-7-phosphate kinase/D-glycero-beta-D-manno-heptose 1-phosphate adenylyltransferase HldE [Gammaproteobacteria bacterium]|nr:bifunctional D-glycero-beta-D-manno-heptose-7-phosphate kinase/D-glycero-beta-D-manno-heptose 1-phosphate adenylyltransferase HldE [Gammaproteobacteria bacterium]